MRERLIAEPAATPIVHVVVTVGDWIADPGGLYLADFDLLTRLPALETIDLVATDGLLGSGFHQRIHDWLPGIEEVEAANGRRRAGRGRRWWFRARIPTSSSSCDAIAKRN